MTAFSDLESAVSAFQGGAFEYLPKPFDLPKAVELIRRAVQESAPEAPIEESADAELEILGKAPAMQEVFRAIGRLSHSSGDGADHRASRAPARSWSRARCTTTARAPARPSSR